MTAHTRTSLLRIGILVTTLGLSLGACEGLLWLLKYPTEVPDQVAHPPRFRETRHNLEYRYTFRTNDRGLRYHTLPAIKTPGSHRVFVCGDSFVEGTGVEEGERFTDLLEGMFDTRSNHVYFINGGLAGTGPFEYMRLFLGVGLGYQPDALLVCLYANDIANTFAVLDANPFAPPPPRSGLRKGLHDIAPRLYTLVKSMQIRRDYAKKTRTTNFLETVRRRAFTQGLPEARIDAWTATVPSDLVAAVNRGEFNGTLLSNGLLYPECWSDSIDLDSEVARAKWRNMTRILAEMTTRCRQEGIGIAMVYIPADVQYDPRSHATNSPWSVTGTTLRNRWLVEDTEIQKRLATWMAEQDIPYLDLTPACRQAVQAGERLNWPMDGHWTPRGHALAAKALEEWLTHDRVFSFLSKTTARP